MITLSKRLDNYYKAYTKAVILYNSNPAIWNDSYWWAILESFNIKDREKFFKWYSNFNKETKPKIFEYYKNKV